MAGKKAKPRKTVKKLVLEGLKPSDVLCPICRTILIEPVSLSCNHAFCKLCFEATMENANLVCPLCRVRVGSWYRKAKKEGKLVNEMLWEAIQSQYPTEIKNRYQGIDNVIEQDIPVIVVATPGEIRKEYEQQRQRDLEEQKIIREAEEEVSAPLIKKLREEEEHKNRIEEEKLRLDEALAKKLAEDLERPTTSKYPYKKTTDPKRLASNKKYGPMDKFIKVEDTKANRQSLTKGEEQKLLYKGGRKRISVTPNPANDFATKEYTCHVLNAESRSIGIANSLSLLNKPNYNKPSYTSGMSVAQRKVKESRKVVESVERKSTSKSGYKSSESGSDDAIDQECKFYFKPIDTQRRHHLPGTIPVKVPSLRGQKALNVYIGPPSGKIINLQLGTVISAFAKFSMALQKKPESKCTPPSEVKTDVKSNHHVGSSNKLKRKLSDMESPVRRKERRQIYTKKNVMLINKTKIISSPFYGFDDESSKLVNRYPFYGFSIREIKHSNCEKDAMIKIIAKLKESEPGNKSVTSIGGFYKTFKTYSRHQNKQFKEPLHAFANKSTEVIKLHVTRTPENDRHISIKNEKVDLESSMTDPNEEYKPQTSIDINRNIPKVTSQPSIGKLGDHDGDASSVNRNRSIKNKACLTNVRKIEDGSDKYSTTGYRNQVKGFSNTKLDSKNLDFRSEDMSKIINNKLPNELDIPLNLMKHDARVYMDTDLKIRSEIMEIEEDYTDNNLPKATSTRKAKEKSGGTKLVSSIEYNRSDMPHPKNNDSNDAIRSRLKPNLQPLITSSSPVNGSWRTRSKKSSSRNALNSLNKEDTISETMNGDWLIVDRNYSTVKSMPVDAASTDSNAPSKTIRLNDTSLHPVNKMYQSKTSNAVFTDTNSRITDTFFKVKSSPTKSHNPIKLKLSPAKTKINNNVELDLESIKVNCEIDNDRRQIQEQSDFEIAKRLQAEFDSIQMPSRTRRGTKRQITLDEMLLV